MVTAPPQRKDESTQKNSEIARSQLLPPQIIESHWDMTRFSGGECHKLKLEEVTLAPASMHVKGYSSLNLGIRPPGLYTSSGSLVMVISSQLGSSYHMV